MPTVISPWHLRSFRHRASSAFDEDENKTVSTKFGLCQKAKDIFASSGDSHQRTGMVDGKKITFELTENVTKRPTKSRKERLEEVSQNQINAVSSAWDVRVRWWLLQFNVPSITLLYVFAFLALNFFFAALWSIQEGQCCDDSSLSYTQIFDFAIQTSTTIGYGGYVPIGYVSNFLVFVVSILALVLNTVYAGLLFLKFVAPSAKIDFSEIMTLSNVNGLPCLELRIGNSDGTRNSLSDLSVRVTYSYHVAYTDEKGEQRGLGQTEELKLLSNKRCELKEVVWTLRHVIDEQSPLFGLDILDYPGSSILQYQIALNATQDSTGAGVFAQTTYMVEDIMIGHRFKDQIKWDSETRVLVCDFANTNETVPHPVWYPTKEESYT